MWRSRTILALALAAGCGGATPDAAGPEPSQPASLSPSEEPISPLVGEWKRVTTCQELVRLLEANGLGARAPQAIEGNGWVGGTLEQLAKKDDPCEGAVPREHSHFFTEPAPSVRSTGEGNRSTTGRMRSWTTARS